MNHDLTKSELKVEWKWIKSEQKLNQKLSTSLFQIMNEHSNDWTPWY
jgi:hypothetical protein